MKILLAALVCMPILTSSVHGEEPAVAKRPFFRPHGNRRIRAAKPHDVGDAVVVNAASYESGISPGALATIFGDNLSTVTGIVLANENPLPTDLARVEVSVAGFSAPIYGVAYANGEDQISIQVPYEAPTGPGAAEIQVFDDGASVADFFADSYTEDPGIFTYDADGINGLAIAEDANYSLIGPENPANAGEALVLYVTGLGPLNDPNLVDGYGAPTTPPFAETVDPFQMVLDGENCTVFFSGLAPGFVGLYQINFYVPRTPRLATCRFRFKARMPIARRRFYRFSDSDRE